jgi:hypothetical protein
VGVVVGTDQADLEMFVDFSVGMLQDSLGSEVGMVRAEFETFVGPVVGMVRAELDLFVVLVVDMVQAEWDHLSTSDWFVGLGAGTVRAGLVDPHIPD